MKIKFILFMPLSVSLLLGSSAVAMSTSEKTALEALTTFENVGTRIDWRQAAEDLVGATGLSLIALRLKYSDDAEKAKINGAENKVNAAQEQLDNWKRTQLNQIKEDAVNFRFQTTKQIEELNNSLETIMNDLRQIGEDFKTENHPEQARKGGLLQKTYKIFEDLDQVRIEKEYLPFFDNSPASYLYKRADVLAYLEKLKLSQQEYERSLGSRSPYNNRLKAEIANVNTWIQQHTVLRTSITTQIDKLHSRLSVYEEEKDKLEDALKSAKKELSKTMGPLWKRAALKTLRGATYIADGFYLVNLGGKLYFAHDDEAIQFHNQPYPVVDYIREHVGRPTNYLYKEMIRSLEHAQERQDGKILPSSQ